MRPGELTATRRRRARPRNTCTSTSGRSSPQPSPVSWYMPTRSTISVSHAGLLADVADRGVDRALVVADLAAGQAPEAVALALLAEQDAAGVVGDDRADRGGERVHGPSQGRRTRVNVSHRAVARRHACGVRIRSGRTGVPCTVSDGSVCTRDPRRDPEPHAGRLAPRPAADPGVRAVHHRSASSLACVVTEIRLRRAGRPAVRGARHRRLGGAVRHHRRPDLPRDHLARRRTSARAATRSRRSTIWEGGLGIWGAVAGGAVGAWIALPPARHPADVRRRRARARACRWRRPSAGWGNWFNNELYGGQTDLPWGLKVYELRPGAGPGATRRPTASRSLRRAPTTRRSCTSAVEPRRRRAGAGCSTAGSSSARAGRSRST